jgi:hypothetical protein
MAFPDKNYTLGKGRLYFDKFIVGTKTTTGQRYIGNTPEITMSLESESLEHFDSDAGVKQKDDSVLLELARSGKFTTDHISPANLALFFLGAEDVVTQTSATAQAYQIVGVKKGLRYQIGATSSVPAGVRGVTNVVVNVSAVPKTAGTDYELDATTGGITILAGGTILDGATLDIVYDRSATSYNRVVTAANAEIYGALLYVSNNPKGEKFDYFWPYVALKPDGDFALKGDDWQQISFSFDALKLNDSTEVCYINGRPGSGV